MLDRDFAAARKTCEAEATNPDENLSRLMALVVIHLLANDAASATNEIEKARGFVEARLRERPNETSLIQLAWINFGSRETMRRLFVWPRRRHKLAPVEKDALLGEASSIWTGSNSGQSRQLGGGRQYTPKITGHAGRFLRFHRAGSRSTIRFGIRSAMIRASNSCSLGRNTSALKYVFRHNAPSEKSRDWTRPLHRHRRLL